MKGKYLAVAIALILLGVINVKALNIGDCKVLASFKLNSSLDEEKYICVGKNFGNSNDTIYYSGEGSTISLNNLEAYYLRTYDNDVTFNIFNSNNISLFHIGSGTIGVEGNGALKFKENSYVKKVVNGEAVYQYVYNQKTITSNGKIFEGTIEEFAQEYELLQESNKLPKEYTIDDYELVQALDYTKMTSEVITDSWIKQNIKTSLKTSIENGYGVVKYVKPVETKNGTTKEKTKSTLKTDNVVLISDGEVDKSYELKEKDLTTEKVATKVSKQISDENDLVSFYDVSVYNGKKEVPMKNGKFTIKIKLDVDVDEYENYKVVYVDDEGKISEYLDGHIEGGYIVFETTHLSQYGVVGTPKKEAFVSRVTINPRTKDWGKILKVTMLMSFVVVASGVISFLIYKSS
jgi:hypothetical protein